MSDIQFYRCCSGIWCGIPTCSKCGQPGLVIYDESGPTQEGRDILNSLVRDQTMRDDLVRRKEHNRTRKHSGQHVEMKCHRCRRLLPQYLPGRMRVKGLLAAHHPQDFPMPGLEVCTCK